MLWAKRLLAFWNNCISGVKRNWDSRFQVSLFRIHPSAFERIAHANAACFCIGVARSRACRGFDATEAVEDRGICVAHNVSYKPALRGAESRRRRRHSCDNNGVVFDDSGEPAKARTQNFETLQLCNSHLPYHPYFPDLTDRHSLSSECLRKWTAGDSERREVSRERSTVSIGRDESNVHF